MKHLKSFKRLNENEIHPKVETPLKHLLKFGVGEPGDDEIEEESNEDNHSKETDLQEIGQDVNSC